jgi:hypothetical protein
MITQRSAPYARDFGLFGRSWVPLRSLVNAKAGKCVARQLRLAFRHLAQQFQEQRQWAWRAFMLQCTINR